VDSVAYSPQDSCDDPRFEAVRDFYVQTWTHVVDPINTIRTLMLTDYVLHIGHCSYYFLVLDYTHYPILVNQFRAAGTYEKRPRPVYSLVLSVVRVYIPEQQ
jgi:hypothetical protein